MLETKGILDFCSISHYATHTSKLISRIPQNKLVATLSWGEYLHCIKENLIAFNCFISLGLKEAIKLFQKLQSDHEGRTAALD